MPISTMPAPLALRFTPVILASFLTMFPLVSKAELFPEGLLGVKLGQTRVAALTALVNEGVVPDLEKAQCSDKVPEKNTGLADRICKLALQPGSAYQGLPLTKVTFLFKDETVVLMGLYVGESENTFGTLSALYQAALGPASKGDNPDVLNWQEPINAVEARKTKVGLWADVPNAFVVYSYEDLR